MGTPLEWSEAKDVAAHVREWGIEVGVARSLTATRGYSWNYILRLSATTATPSDLATSQGKRARCATLGR